MSGLSNKYDKILSDIENNISNPEEKKYVIKKIGEISGIYTELIDKVVKLNNERMDALEEKQEKLIGTLSKVQETVNLIKSDIYEDENYEFEIVCPYCNHNFIADIESELKEEIECPECHNIIELDWDDKEDCTECNEHCSSCNHKDCLENDDENEDDM